MEHKEDKPMTATEVEQRKWEWYQRHDKLVDEILDKLVGPAIKALEKIKK